MRYMIISDIHGSPLALQTVLTRFTENNYDYLIILGDILYHGPRNPLPTGYNPQEVVSLLNPLASKIIACRGNCDAEVDQMLLDFPCMATYERIIEKELTIFATHGHLYNAEHFPKGPCNNLFLYGHTHLWELEKKDNLIICNPGSITLPKENRPATYATYENGTLSIMTLTHEVLKQISF